MPIAIIDTRNDDPSITRNVVNSIIEGLTKKLSLPQSLRIEYWGDIGSAYQPGSAIGDKSNDIKLASDGKILVEIDEQYDDDSLINHPTHEREEPPYWIDGDLGLMLRPVRTQSILQFTFTYRAPTKTAANRFRNSIKMLATGGREMHMYELEYHVPVPNEFIILAGDIHRCRETQGGYGDKFGKYLKDHSLSNITTISVDGRKPTLVIPERQLPVMGWFNELVVNKPTKDDESSTYTVTFDYTVQYQKIIGFVINYPIMVHNQLIHSDLWDDAPAYTLQQRLYRPGVMQDHTIRLQHMYNPARPNIAGVRIPEFDPWLPTELPTHTLSLMTVLLGVVPNDENRLMSFGDIQGYEIDPAVYRFMLDEAPYMTKRYKSFFQLDVYKDNNLLDMPCIKAVEEDGELVVYSLVDIDIRAQYHIRLSVTVEYGVLDHRAQESMKVNGIPTWDIIRSLGDEGGTLYGNELDYPDFVYGTYLPDKVIRDSLGKYIPNKIPREHGADFMLVQFLSIITKTGDS